MNKFGIKTHDEYLKVKGYIDTLKNKTGILSKDEKKVLAELSQRVVKYEEDQSNK